MYLPIHHSVIHFAFIYVLALFLCANEIASSIFLPTSSLKSTPSSPQDALEFMFSFAFQGWFPNGFPFCYYCIASCCHALMKFSSLVTHT